MNAVLIGISGGLLVMLFIGLLKGLNKQVVYGLILTGIGFLYVGFTWSNVQALVVNCLQAIFFLFLSYFGIKKSMLFLVAGYFLHGTWDIIYHLFPGRNLIPPHYDLFCLSIDFTMGLYLLVLNYKMRQKRAETVVN
jgi:hypothetical protein